MLVTISGMVGSGKTTAARHVVKVIRQDALEGSAWRFRSLACFRWLQRSSSTVAPSQKGIRGERYRAKRLTAGVAFGYVLRLISFRLFRRRKLASGCHVMTRYFYDNLVHYELKLKRERLYVWLLRWLVPVPDLAILLVASTDTISTRRPQYAMEYLVGVQSGYQSIRRWFPELIEINTDQGGPALSAVEALVTERLQHARRSGRHSLTSV